MNSSIFNSLNHEFIPLNHEFNSLNHDFINFFPFQFPAFLIFLPLNTPLFSLLSRGVIRGQKAPPTHFVPLLIPCIFNFLPLNTPLFSLLSKLFFFWMRITWHSSLLYTQKGTRKNDSVSRVDKRVKWKKREESEHSPQ